MGQECQKAGSSLQYHIGMRTTLKQAVPGKAVINVLILVTATYSHTDVLKLIGMLVHTFLITKLKL